MRLIALHIFKWQEENALLLASAYELSALWFYQRGAVRDVLLHHSRLIASYVGTWSRRRIKPNERQRVELEENKGVCYAYCTAGHLCLTAVTDAEYPERAGFGILYELGQNFIETFKTHPEVMAIKADTQLSYPGINALLVKWQKPEDSTGQDYF
jgi:hypothetical protein